MEIEKETTLHETSTDQDKIKVLENNVKKLEAELATNQTQKEELTEDNLNYKRKFDEMAGRLECVSCLETPRAEPFPRQT